MRFPFSLDLRSPLGAAGFDVDYNALLVDSKVAVNQRVRLDGVDVDIRIVLTTDRDTTILEATPHIDPITTAVLDDVKDYEGFNKKLQTALSKACRNLRGTKMKPGRRGQNPPGI